MTGVTYDSGALIAAERSERRMWARHRALLLRRVVPTVPAPVIAQCWRGTPRQAQLARLLTGCETETLDDTRPGPPEPWPAAPAPPTSSTPASSKVPCAATTSSSAPTKAISRPSPQPSAAASTSTTRNTRSGVATQHYQLWIVELIASRNAEPPNLRGRKLYSAHQTSNAAPLIWCREAAIEATTTAHAC